jgi:hypothetical protein
MPEKTPKKRKSSRDLYQLTEKPDPPVDLEVWPFGVNDLEKVTPLATLACRSITSNRMQIIKRDMSYVICLTYNNDGWMNSARYHMYYFIGNEVIDVLKTLPEL